MAFVNIYDLSTESTDSILQRMSALVYHGSSLTVELQRKPRYMTAKENSDLKHSLQVSQDQAFGRDESKGEFFLSISNFEPIVIFLFRLSRKTSGTP